MVATNMVMDANAAISRRMSVIAGSFPLMFILCSHYVQRVKRPFSRFLEVSEMIAKPHLSARRYAGRSKRLSWIGDWWWPVRRSEFENPALVERDAAIHSGGEFVVMGGDHRGQPGLANERCQRIEDIACGFRIEITGRLVG